MAIDRKLWRREISANYVPNWPCLNCRATSLAVVKDSFTSVYDWSTNRWQDDRDFEPEAATGRFACLLYCTKAGCGETCAVSGNYSAAVDFNEHGQWTYASGCPKSITPPPPMIPIPEDCPKSIQQEVVAAFTLYWCDHAACLNRIRNSLELLLTDLKIPRTTLSRPKKEGDPKERLKLSLHSRIEKLEKKKPKLRDICKRMMAVKHLGNAGSHPEDVTVDDVFDGFDILERVLQDTYSDHESELARTVTQINKRKGPRKGRG